MKPQEIKLPSIEKVKQEAIESAAAYKEKSKSAVSQELLNLKKQILKMPIPPTTYAAAHLHSQSLQNLSDNEKVAKLVEIAFEKGPLTAVTTARKINDAHILDALHDTLTKDELFQKLVALGKI